jgi:hypothetical protein
VRLKTRRAMPKIWTRRANATVGNSPRFARYARALEPPEEPGVVYDTKLAELFGRGHGHVYFEGGPVIATDVRFTPKSGHQ